MVGGSGAKEGKVVHVGECETIRDFNVETRDINDEEERGNGRTLGGAHRHRGEDIGGP